MPIKFSSLTTKGIDNATKLIGLYNDSNSTTGVSNCLINIADFAKKVTLDSVDSSALHKSGTETVTGSKTFSGATTFSGASTFTTQPLLQTGNTSPRYKVKMSNYQQGTTPSSNIYAGLDIYDKNNVEMGTVFTSPNTNGSVRTALWVRSPVANSNKTAEIYVAYDSNDNVYTYAPTPASGDNSTKIATTNWCVELIKRIYPVGSIYIGTNTTCPMATIIPGSTWTLVAANKALWTGTGSNANTTIEAGLPNITASGFMGEAPDLPDFINQARGALYYTGSGLYGSRGGIDRDDTTGYFDASRCSSIYGKSDTVQPPAYVVNVWRRTA